MYVTQTNFIDDNYDSLDKKNGWLNAKRSQTAVRFQALSVFWIVICLAYAYHCAGTVEIEIVWIRLLKAIRKTHCRNRSKKQAEPLNMLVRKC